LTKRHPYQLYLVAVQEAYSRAIVGWSMAEHMRAELVVDALKIGLHRRPDRGLVHDSETSRGCIPRSA
jgi:transposase InsO family protein